MVNKVSGLCILLFSCMCSISMVAQLPDGFEIETILIGDEPPMGTTFVNDSTFYYWQCDGTVWAVINDQPLPDPVLNIQEEVGCWGDQGMLGLALDPNFQINGFIYLLYQVDFYHELYKDSANYDPFGSWNYFAGFGRVTRYTIDISDYLSTVADSRHVLLGETMENAIPEMSSSHSVGSLVFGADGTLMISCGDGSTWWGHFNGGSPHPEFAYDSLGLAYNILTPSEDIGAFRAQYKKSYNGKVLRIDPETGLGLPSNPYYDEELADRAISKVWASGLRNPFRMVYRPNTGVTNPTLGQPGDFIVSDVGHYTWEEINYCDGPGLNFGWPVYEGMDIYTDYFNLSTPNYDYENELYDPVTCPEEHINFQNLIVQENAQHEYSWSNPCDALVEIADSVLRSVHRRPALAYQNIANQTSLFTVLPGFDSNGNAVATTLASQSEVVGEPFLGIASIGGAFYSGTRFPEEYFGAYFQSDYSGWTRAFWFDEENRIAEIEHFSSEIGTIVHTSFNPFDECLYFSSVLPVGIKRVCYQGNVRPIVTAEADVIFGQSPLAVEFTGSASFDPDGDPITYLWEFGDGDSGIDADIDHVFTADSEAPQSFEVYLSVTDTAGNTGQDYLLISVNNTPPVVDITSIEDGQLYSIITEGQLLDLQAAVSDLEHDESQLDYRWELVLHHNTHVHVSDTELNPGGQFQLEGVGCDPNETYYFSVRLKVTDAHGLSGSDEVFLYPDCTEEPSIYFPEFVLYPNPTSGLFSIRGPLNEDIDYTLRAFTLDGRLILNQTAQIDASGRLGALLPSKDHHLYLVQLIGPDVNWVQKVLIER